MILKPQDIVVLLKLSAMESKEWSFASLAADLYMSPSEVHAGIKRATAARLFDETRKIPVRKNLEEFLVHGVKYAYTPIRTWVRKQMRLETDTDFVIHCCRHTCASRLVNAGVDLYVVKEWLGHSTIKITERYAHLDPGKLAHAVEVLEK